MSKVYSDIELKIVSQLAYCNLDSDEYRELIKGRSDDNPVTLQELFQKKKRTMRKTAVNAGDWRNVQALTYTDYFEGVFKMRK